MPEPRYPVYADAIHWLFDQGQIRVTSTDDGSSLLFGADGGDTSNAVITIDDAPSGTVYSWQTWADIFQRCCI